MGHSLNDELSRQLSSMNTVITYVFLVSLLISAYAFRPSRTAGTTANKWMSISVPDSVRAFDEFEEDFHPMALSTVTDSTFDMQVLDDSTSQLQVVLFTSEWARGLHGKMTAVVEAESQRLANKNVQFHVCDTDANFEAAAEFNVRSIPSILLIKNREVIGEMIGVQSRDAIANLILNNISVEW